jgi:carbamoylphosphate synthase large subunit
VDLVVPLIDPDLPVLARSRDVIEKTGARVLVSSAESIDICRDKARTQSFLAERGIATIPTLTWEQAETSLPLVVKPRAGSASEGIFIVETRPHLALIRSAFPDSLIQPRIAGHEYTVDSFCDPSTGSALAPVPRRRIRVRGGEVSVSRVELGLDMEIIARRALEALRLEGPVNVQVIAAADGARVLEINPRFGGGCPLSVRAGAPYIDWCLDVALRRQLDSSPVEILDGLTMTRYDMSLFIPPS